MAGFERNSRQLNVYFCGFFILCSVLLLPCYNCCATDAKRFRHNAKTNSLKHRIPSSSKGHDVGVKKLNNVALPSLFAKAKGRTSKKHFVDKDGQKRDNFVTIPEPFPVNKFEEEPYLDHHTRYIPQPYPVSHVEYVAKPIAVPVEVPNQLKVQHFHIHRDREYLSFNYREAPFARPNFLWQISRVK